LPNKPKDDSHKMTSEPWNYKPEELVFYYLNKHILSF